VRGGASVGRKAIQLDTGWRGYFIGRAVHSTKVERGVSIDRWWAQLQHRLSGSPGGDASSAFLIR